MTENQSQREAREAMEAIIAKALPADADIEDQLLRLEQLAARIRVPADLKAQYEYLRDVVAKQLVRNGPRYYLDHDGVKRYAYPVQPEPVEVNVEELTRMWQAKEISDETYWSIVGLKVDKEAFRREASAGRITKDQLKKVAKVKKGTAYVKVVVPEQGDDDD